MNVEVSEALLETVLLELEKLFILCRNNVVKFVLRYVNIRDVLLPPVKEV